ncbi:MAG TPA: hypothetical protein VIL34_01005 [Actinopolymorphaceae bacterium]|jgi:hypothetical protein
MSPAGWAPVSVDVWCENDTTVESKVGTRRPGEAPWGTLTVGEAYRGRVSIYLEVPGIERMIRALSDLRDQLAAEQMAERLAA